MQIIRDLHSPHQISNTAIWQLVQQRIKDLGGEAFDSASLGYFLVIEAGDTLDAIDTQLGFPILANRFTGIHYSDTGFTPSFEFVEEFATCYEMVFIISDDGFGIEVFVPKRKGCSLTCGSCAGCMQCRARPEHGVSQNTTTQFPVFAGCASVDTHPHGHSHHGISGADVQAGYC